MFVTLSARTVLITSTRSKTGEVRARPSSTSGVLRDTGSLGEHAEPRGAQENTEIYAEGVRPGAEVGGLTQANLKRHDDKDSLASVVSSLSPSETTPVPGFEEMTKVPNAMVKAWRRAARKGKGKDAALRLMFGATWGDAKLEIPCGELDVSASAHSSEWEPD